MPVVDNKRIVFYISTILRNGNAVHRMEVSESVTRDARAYGAASRVAGDDDGGLQTPSLAKCMSAKENDIHSHFLRGKGVPH